MSIFKNNGLGWTGKREEKEQRDNTINYVTPYGTSLPFTQMVNKYSAMNISAVYRAVEIISDSVAMLPIKIKQVDKQHSEIMDEHPLNFVFENNLISKFNLIKLLLQSVMLRGNGFAYIHRANDGTAIGLQFLQAEDVTISYNKQKQELYYLCNIVSKKKIEPCNMIHLIKNTYDGINGVSVLSYANRSIQLASNTENSANSFFTNGCNLSGVLTVQGQLNDKQRNDIRTSWNQAYANGGNGLAILQGNMAYQPIQLNAADSQMLESRQFNVEDIARFFGISPILLGDLSHASYNSIEALQQMFLLHTLQPYITLCEEEFTRKLFKPSEKNLVVNFDETAMLKTDKEKLANYYAKLLEKGVLCVDEVRREMGYSEIGAKDHIIPYTNIAQNNVINNKDNDNDVDTSKV